MAKSVSSTSARLRWQPQTACLFISFPACMHGSMFARMIFLSFLHHVFASFLQVLCKSRKCADIRIRTYTLTSYVDVWTRSHTHLQTCVCVPKCMGMHTHLHVAQTHTHTHTHDPFPHVHIHNIQEHTRRKKGPLRSCLYMYHSSRYPRKQSPAGLFVVVHNWCRHPAHVI